MKASFGWLLTIFCFLYCIHDAQSVPSDVLDCDPGDEYFKAGSAYFFKYNAKAISASVGTTDHLTAVHIQCNGKVRAFSGCQYVMNISNCNLGEIPSPGNGEYQKTVQHNDSHRFNDDLVRYSVLFSMAKGHIRQIWAHEHDPLYAVNVKRGIVSAMLISRIKSKYSTLRTDVQGVCPVTYTVSKDMVQMEKNISDCHFPSRPSLHLSPFSLFWNMSFIQMWWINSTAKCDFNLAGGTLHSTTCHERHAIRLESSYATTTAVQTLIKQSLVFDSVEKSDALYTDTTSGRRATGILFEYENFTTSNVSSKDFLSKVMKNIQDLANTTADAVFPYSIEIFDEILALLRGASQKDLTEFVDRLQAENEENDIHLASKYGFALEALVQCNTNTCIEGLLHIFENMTDANKSWIYWGSAVTSLVFSPPSDPQSIANITSKCMVLKSRQCVLSSSSMIHSFWVANNQSGNKLPECLKTVVQNFKTATGNETDDQLLYVKALRNIGEVADEAIPDIFETLKLHFENETKGNVWQMAVVEATERLKPTEERRKWTSDIVKNSSRDSEIRAIAFKILAASWNNSLDDDIKDLRSNTESESDSVFLNFIHQQLEKRPTTTLWQTPFLKDRINKFGWESDFWQLFHQDYIKPIIQKLNVAARLFGKTFNFDATYYSKVFDDEAINDGIKSWLLELLFGEKEDRREESREPLRTLERIRRLVNFRKKFKAGADGDSKLWFLSTKLFGDELFYLTGDDTNGSSLRTTVIEFLQHFFTQSSSATRLTSVTRFIDAYNQVPTLIGLPLNWTTNASVAFGLRSNISQPSSDITAADRVYHIMPSLAITFVNRMALDVPQFTKIGVQANTTAYTFMEFNVSVESQPGEFTVRYYPPKRKQIVGLTRVNHLIRGDVLENIPDWDVERVNQTSCLNSTLAWSGVVLCYNATYANVTNRVKPWTLMAADANFTLTAEFPENLLKEYKLKIKVAELPQRGKALYRVFLNSQTQESNEISVSHEKNWVTGEFETKILVPKWPYLGVTFRKDVGDNETLISANATILPNATLSLIYKTRDTGESRAEVVDNRRSSSIISPVTTSQRWLNLTTPWSKYEWTQTLQQFSTFSKFDQIYSFQSVQDKGSWFHSILPDFFWEDSKKDAWLHLHWYIKQSTSGSGNNTYGFCKIPKSIIEISNENEERVQPFKSYIFRTNITKRFLPSYELKTFMNLTYEEQSGNSSDSTKYKKANLTLPGQSWIVQYNDSKSQKYFILRKENMVKNDKTTQGEWPGWWDAGVVENFSAESWNATLNVSSPSLNAEQKCWNVSLTYPGKHNAGYITGSSCLDVAGGWRDLLLYSSDLEVKLNSHIQDKSNQSSHSGHDLIIDGTIAHEPSTQTINYLALLNEDNVIYGNTTIELWTTSDYQFSLNKSTSFGPNYEESKTWLNISACSNSWNPLDVDLRQVWKHQLKNPRFQETMLMTHDWMNIYVEASLNQAEDETTKVASKSPKYEKEFKFNSKNPLLANSTWKIESNVSVTTVHVHYPDKADNIFWIFLLEVGPQKDTELRICHDKLCSGYETDPEHTVLQTKINFINPWLLRLNINYNNTLLDVYTRTRLDAMRAVFVAVMSALGDPNHEINKLWGPVLGGKTFIEFIQEKNTIIEMLAQQTWENILKAVSTWEPFYEPSFDIVKRTYAYAMYKSYGARLLRDSHIGWFWNHFEISDVIKEWAIASPLLLLKTIFGVQPNADSSSGYTVQWEHPTFKWSNFSELPAFTASVKRHWLQLTFDFERPKWVLSDYNENAKMAAIFGEDMLLTFDGKSYQVPGYVQKRCRYLLAHDFAQDSFSILSTFDTLQIWYSESSGVILDSKGDYKIIGEIGQVEISTEGDVTTVTSPHLRVICASQKYACLIYLDDFMHNKTLGLLGNNNRDPEDDWKTPNGEQAEDVVELLRSYEVSGNAICKNRIALENLQKKMCSEHSEGNVTSCPIFANASICADVVPTKHFEEVCSTQENCGQGCYILYAYHLACLSRGVPIATEGPCWKCEGELTVGESDDRKDVHFQLLIEDHKMLGKYSFHKGLEKLVQTLISSFESVHYKNMKLSVITYSGRGTEPLKIKLNREKADDVVALKLLRGLDITGTVEGNSLEALDALLDLDVFDDTDANAIFIFASRDLTDTKGQTTVSGVLQKLQSHRYTSLFSFSDYITGAISKKVFGVRGDGYAFPQPKKGPEIFVDYPKGNVAKVTSGVKGSVFEASALEDPAALPRFTASVADEVVSTVNKGHMPKVCTCEPSIGIDPKLKCAEK